MLIGLTSDKHSLVRAKSLNALQGSQPIIHAGDEGRPEVLPETEAVEASPLDGCPLRPSC